MTAPLLLLSSAAAQVGSESAVRFVFRGVTTTSPIEIDAFAARRVEGG